ncbi:MAG TPA: hypothetical protein VGG07_20910 [Solirubrobacteraceae bacterium]|jgi:hypothetical protein
MTIPVADPMAGYPQPFATWATVLRNAAEAQGDAGADNAMADASAEHTGSIYTVDYTA